MPTRKTPFALSPLDPRLVGPKPIESAPHSILEEVESRGDLIKQRKRNGYNTLVSVTGRRKRRVGFYSSNIAEVTAKFPLLKDEVLDLSIPADTLLVGEMLAQEKGVDSPGLYTSIIKSLPERAIELQKTHPVTLAFFNVLVFKGKSIAHYPYIDRLEIIRELLAKHSGGHAHLVEVLDMSLCEAQALSRKSKWEGLVLYDQRAGSSYLLGSGQTPRPLGCWKWKEYTEGDFVATGFVPSTAKSHLGAVKDLLLGQYNQEGVLEHWGKCGIGISESERRRLADPALYPLVFEIKFERRTKNRRLIFSKIMRQRFDKKPEECISPPDWEAQL